MQWIFATHNTHKFEEMRALASKEGITLHSLSQWPDLQSPDESAPTFVENALIKARYTRHQLHLRGVNMPVLADDSGIGVPALGSAQPGVHTARYGGPLTLLQAMEGREDRSACFFCVLVLLKSHDDPAPDITQGQWWSEIVTRERYELSPLKEGFGYDPVWWIPEKQATVSELPLEYKQQHSHRAQAWNALMQHMRNKRHHER